MFRFVASMIGVLVFATGVSAQSGLENPQAGSHQSGVGLISGWKCTGTALTAAVDGMSPFPVLYGSPRGDTQGVCSDTNNGFGVLVNWNLLSNGAHTIRLYDAGVEFASATFTVQTLGGEFLRGLSKTVEVPNFPNPGQTTTLQWAEAAQNFAITNMTGGGGGGATCTTKTKIVEDSSDNVLTIQITNPCDTESRLFWQLRASPDNEGGFFFCSINVVVVQQGLQFEYSDAFSFKDDLTSGSVCTSILPGVTINATLDVDSGIPLDFTQPFSVFYDDVKLADFP